MKASNRLFELMGEVKLLAQEYYELTEKPLGVTGEVAEYEAARVLKLDLSPPRQAGFDAVHTTPHGVRRFQIKGRRSPSAFKSGQRLGAIDLEKEWDAVLLVLLDEDFELTAIHEAGREAVAEALTAPGSRARNHRGQLSISGFRAIARQVWPLEEIS